MKHAPNDHRMPQVKSSDERRDNPRSDLKLPEKIDIQKVNYPSALDLNIIHKLNALVDFLALQKEG